MILFVGDKPSRYNYDPDIVFVGAICKGRLAKWIRFITGYSKLYTALGLPLDGVQLINSTHERFRINASYYHTQRYPIIALGNAASKALHLIPHFKLPHPSGRNRQINDKAFIQSRLEAAREYVLSHSDKKE